MVGLNAQGYELIRVTAICGAKHFLLLSPLEFGGCNTNGELNGAKPP